jgi:tetratricopeptide (TPR) repeat protein
MSLLADILTLLGAFFLGFFAGQAYPPLRHFVGSLLSAPGQLTKGAKNVGDKLRQAFRAPAEEPLDRSGISGTLAGTVFDIMTLRVRRAEASFRAGIANFERGEFDAARRRFSEAIFWDSKCELRPLHVLARLNLGWLDEEQGALVEAKEHYRQAVHLDSGNLKATVRLGMIHFRLGETGPAIFQFQRALELDPGDLDTHYYLYAIYRHAGMERESLEQLRILKAGENAETLVELFARHAEDSFRLGHYEEATCDYELALQIDPAHVPLYTALGDLHYLQQQPRTALDTWCRGLWFAHSDAIAERLLTVSVEVDDVHPAIQLLRDVLAQHAEDGRYLLLLAHLLSLAGRESEAAAQLERAVQKNPHLLEGQVELGDRYARAGHVEQASAIFRTGLVVARSDEVVFHCRVCGHVTAEEQPRCFGCGRWGTLDAATRAQVEASSAAPRNLLERAQAARQSLSSFWNKIAGQLPSGE